ncbi:SDR family oxidoreductase [Saccharospirillum salsuginis]|uniref:NAD(P)-binding domain-containing protein n=1 Tax=Saccharospirillum salsuginis TaxID=418750 RepID=A0A918K222_9GAMM|nr:NAD(P)H-binding protein [Saccharospirillum salsuginis]GGX43756.1 hypothetical protein GCM10007392_08130 [Saccharospirillum salsuginis]
MKTASVIGGSGMLGAPVARQLRADGYRVRVISRNSDKAERLLGPDFEYETADLLDVDSLRRALKGSDAVHINASGHSRRSYYNNHVLGTKNILEALSDERIECISMISTALAYPEFADRWDNRYKMEAEALLKASGLPYLVFMPSWFMETLALFKQKQRLVHIGPSTQPIHWIAAQDYAREVSRALADPSVRNRRIVLYGSESMTMAEAMAAYARHHDLKVQRMPAWLAKAVGFISRDETLMDVADLMRHYDRAGEKPVVDAVRTTTTLKDWLGSQRVSENLTHRYG